MEIRSIFDFHRLNESEQEAAVFEQGRFLANRESDEERVNLYGLGDFYVEVFYDVERNEVVRFRAFTTDRLLEPYLHRVELNQLET